MNEYLPPIPDPAKPGNLVMHYRCDDPKDAPILKEIKPRRNFTEAYLAIAAAEDSLSPILGRGLTTVERARIIANLETK